MNADLRRDLEPSLEAQCWARAIALLTPELSGADGGPSTVACERSFATYAQAAWPLIEPHTPLVWNWHLDAICEHLEDVTRGKIRNLLITVPPRSGKSSLVSVLWPTWSWIDHPESRWLTASYAQALSTRDALRARRVMQSDWYQRKWGHRYRLTGDQNLKSRYENNHGGYRLATSVGGGATGEGGSVLLVDDAHNLQEIHSETIRLGTLSWWDEVMASRLNDPKTGAKVIIMQRCHAEDLAGHVLAQGGYVHLKIPMEYQGEPVYSRQRQVDPRTTLGQLLWPARFGAAEAEDLRTRRLGAWAYHAQYNQEANPLGGTIFQRIWWRYWVPTGVTAPPVHVRLPDGSQVDIMAEPLPDHFDEQLQSWDMSFKGLQDSDFVSGQVWGRLGADKYLLDRAHGRWSFVATQQALRRLSAKWPMARRKLIEDTANGPAIVDSLRHELPGMVPVTPQGGKEARAHAVTADIQAGNVYLPHPQLAPWVQELLQECEVFPRGTHDDDVDALTQALTYWFRPYRVVIGKASGL